MHIIKKAQLIVENSAQTNFRLSTVSFCAPRTGGTCYLTLLHTKEDLVRTLFVMILSIITLNNQHKHTSFITTMQNNIKHHEQLMGSQHNYILSMLTLSITVPESLLFMVYSHRQMIQTVFMLIVVVLSVRYTDCKLY